MKKISTLVLLTVLFSSFSLTAQVTISGPAEVCPNTEVQYTVSSPDITGVWSVTPNSNYTIVVQTMSTLLVKFGDAGPNATFTVRYTKSGATGFKDVKVKSVLGYAFNYTQQILCAAGRYTFRTPASPYVDLAATTTSAPAGWTFVDKVLWTDPADPKVKRIDVTYDVPEGVTGQVFVDQRTNCPGVTAQRTTFDVVRAPSETKPSPTPVSTLSFLCPGQTGTLEVQPVAGASHYEWTSTAPSLKMNGQTGTVITTVPYITISEPTNSYAAFVDVRAVSTCWSTQVHHFRFYSGFDGFEIEGTGNYMCAGDVGVYWSSPSPAGVSYTWSAASGSVTSGQGTFRARIRWLQRAQYGEVYLDLAAPGCASKEVFSSQPLDDCSSVASVVAFPNPATSQLSVQLNQDELLSPEARLGLQKRYITEIRLTDRQGNLLRQQRYSGDQQIVQVDVSTLKPDIYVLQVKLDGRKNEWKSRQIIVGPR